MTFSLTNIFSLLAAAATPAAVVHASGVPVEEPRYRTRWHMWMHKYWNWSGFIGTYKAVTPNNTTLVASGLCCEECGFMNTHRIHALPEAEDLRPRTFYPMAWVKMDAEQQRQLQQDIERQRALSED